MSALYPDVPDVPGVPPVLRQAFAVASGESLLTDDQSDDDDSFDQSWGIYTQDGDPALDTDSTLAVEYTGEYRVADYPLEQGAFESYNKVAMPFDTRVSVSKGGTVADREQFLSDIDDLLTTLDLFNVVTPERTYLDVNVVGARLSRTASNGAGMITVELALREIRIAPPATLRNSKEPAGADTVNDGTVQAKPATGDVEVVAIGGHPLQ